VNAKEQVETRSVVAPQAIGDRWLITNGLKEGDRVIISGLQKVHPGATVVATPDSTATKAS
jgi:multidrug efflux system membrane fusion protein